MNTSTTEDEAIIREYREWERQARESKAAIHAHRELLEEIYQSIQTRFRSLDAFYRSEIKPFQEAESQDIYTRKSKSSDANGSAGG